MRLEVFDCTMSGGISCILTPLTINTCIFESCDFADLRILRGMIYAFTS